MNTARITIYDKYGTIRIIAGSSLKKASQVAVIEHDCGC